MPRSSTSVMGLDDKKGRQELRPRGPSSMLPLSSVIKDAFDKFEHDFQALIYLRVNTSHLLLPLQSGTRWGSLPGRTPFAAVNGCLVCYPGIFLNLIQFSAVRQYLGWVRQFLLVF